MGEKDYQQYYLVKKFIENRYKVKIIKCKTLRSINKVALSSRNLLLSRKDLTIAKKIFKELMKLKKVISKKNAVNKYLELKKGDLMERYQIKIDYLENRNIKNLKETDNIMNSKIFIAYYLNEIRLIDNL